MDIRAAGWAEISAGRFGIPSDATHFRWSQVTSQRQKMCDGGALYELSNPQDRPTALPNGAVRVFPVIVGDDEKVEPIVIKKPNGSDPITYVVIEFDRGLRPDGGDVTVSLLRTLEKSIELNNKPTTVLAEHIARLEAKLDDQAKVIAELDGGPFIRFCNDHPALVKEFFNMAIAWGKMGGELIKLKVEKEKSLLAANKSIEAKQDAAEEQ